MRPENSCVSAVDAIADNAIYLHNGRMGALSTVWTLFATLPMWLAMGGSFSEDEAFAPYDLRIGNDHFLGADPIQPEKWVTSSDHPESIIRRSESGEVGIAFDINESGRVVNCRVTSESGQSRFDSVPCKLLIRRARFMPQANAKEIHPGARGEMRFRFDDAN